MVGVVRMNDFDVLFVMRKRDWLRWQKEFDDDMEASFLWMKRIR
jgi:hypothetical protein